MNTQGVAVDENTEKASNTSFSFESLEAVRKKLLDLSGRNVLLNYKHPQAGCIRLVDELPDQVMEVLDNGGEFTFIPVPEPTEKQLIDAGYIEIDPETKEQTKSEYPTPKAWAKHLGLATNYELPEAAIADQKDAKHQDTNLQTLFYGPQLEVKLRAIRGKAETAIEESGANILFLALGFLEWYESNDTERSRLAPLYTLPVQLKRERLKGGETAYRYTISLKDDGLITNITLKEKLAESFNLELPDIEEGQTPEQYFALVEKSVLQHKPNWKVRRQATLAMLNFTKQAMYKDLDPENWPDGHSIVDHDVIQKFFGLDAEESQEEGVGYHAEHNIDDIDNIHDDFPLIFEADSSQHSALIDAVGGRNLVIEGPPGSGKSQTITNLIAACIANGQRVLFVAEKMAALNVVKDRLDRANLGDFCLELHSHKTNKQLILADLNNRLNKQSEYRQPTQIKDDIGRIEHYVKQLNDYVALINSDWKKTGLSIHAILNRATRFRQQLEIVPDTVKIEGVNGEILTSLKRKELADHVEMLRSIFEQVSAQADEGKIQNHYWYGVRNNKLAGYQTDSVVESLVSWNQQLHSLLLNWQPLVELLDLNTEDSQSLDDIYSFAEVSKKLPDLKGGELIAELPHFLTNKEAIESFTASYAQYHATIEQLSKNLNDSVINDDSSGDTILASIDQLESFGRVKSASLIDLHKDLSGLTELSESVSRIEDGFNLILPNLPSDLQNAIALTPQGLGEFKKLVGLLSQLPSDLWRYRSDVFDNPDLDPLLDNFVKRFEVVTPLHSELAEVFSLHRLPSSNELKVQVTNLSNQSIFRFLSSDWRAAKREILVLCINPKALKKQAIELAPKLLDYVLELEELDRLNKENPSLDEQYQGAETPLDRIVSLRSWYRAIRTEYGIGFGERAHIGNAVLSLDRNLAIALLDSASKGLLDDVDKALTLYNKFSSSYSAVPDIKSVELSLKDCQSPINNLNDVLIKQAEILQTSCSKPELSLGDIKGLAESLSASIAQRVLLKQDEAYLWLNEINPCLAFERGQCADVYLENIAATLAIAECAAESSLMKKSFGVECNSERYKGVLAHAEQLNMLCSDIRAKYESFAELVQLDGSEWHESCGRKLSSLIERNKRAIENGNWLATWLDYLNLKVKLSVDGLNNFVANLETKLIKTYELSDILEFAVSHQLSVEILEEHEGLALFSGMEQMAVRERFQDYDRKLLALQRETIAFKASRTTLPAGQSSGRVSEYTEIALIKHEAGKKTRHIAVRNLLQRAGESIQALKPCFMMSPMSVAQYLEPGKFEFDIVIMDEASQIRPEDALGAVARGSSVVVVGDPKQLPPTSFFEKATESESEDSVALEGAESILEAVMPSFANRRLRWHYRSRHESLIAFSNKHFYDDNLILFPSPFQETEEFGIRYTRVKKGRFSSQRNVEEAKAIVEAAIEHLLINPNESIGLVAMSAEQRDELERQLEQSIKENGIARDAYEKNMQTAEPLFIKNLENVQGDERDVIVISMTYGPEHVGERVKQYFGPINRDVGWRRLNVLFTRSKKRMHIFSSMDSSDVLIGPATKKGVQSLRAFLEYCERGHLHNAVHTGKAADSDFEIAVMQELKKHGYECEPQLGVAGYFLDIAVRDPGDSGRFLMGVECDGASYHSAKSARDRDRLRQDILESLGWNIKRIWSTDWFKNPEAQIKPILAELSKLRTTEVSKAKTETPVHDDESEADTDYEFLVSINDDLKGALTRFKNDVILKETPNTALEKRLLRPSMLDALLEFKPCSKAEFVEKIPSYLRTGTEPDEAKYLDEVLSIIAGFDE